VRETGEGYKGEMLNVMNLLGDNCPISQRGTRIDAVQPMAVLACCWCVRLTLQRWNKPLQACVERGMGERLSRAEQLEQRVQMLLASSPPKAYRPWMSHWHVPLVICWRSAHPASRRVFCQGVLNGPPSGSPILAHVLVSGTKIC
jgi:hypothetical protein